MTDKKQNDKLYLVTLTNSKSFYVIAKHPTSAWETVKNFVNDADFYFIADRKLKSIEEIAENHKYAHKILLYEGINNERT